MRLFTKNTVLSVVAAFTLFSFSPDVKGGEGIPPSEGARITLEELQRMALDNNPTLVQAEAEVRAAEGRKIQAGLYPNPVVGYDGEEISTVDPSERGIHSFFVEQRIVTAGKLTQRRQVYEYAGTEAEIGLDEQKKRIMNDVKILYYRMLGAQRIVELRRKLAALAREAVGITNQLYNVGQADRADVLAAEVEAQKAELDLLNAENRAERVWRALADMIGKPDLPGTPLAGELEGEVSTFERKETLDALLQKSPQIERARVRVQRWEQVLRREMAERYPDVFLRAGYTYNLEPDESQVLLGISVPLPLFDRNQGNIAAAKGELKRAREEVRRVEMALRDRFAATFGDYEVSRRIVERYKEAILPEADKSYQLFLSRFRQMAASYPQVLIAQRSFFQAGIDYIEAQVTLRQSIGRIEGLLLSGGLEPVTEVTSGFRH